MWKTGPRVGSVNMYRLRYGQWNFHCPHDLWYTYTKQHLCFCRVYFLLGGEFPTAKKYLLFFLVYFGAGVILLVCFCFSRKFLPPLDSPLYTGSMSIWESSGRWSVCLFKLCCFSENILPERTDCTMYLNLRIFGNKKKFFLEHSGGSLEQGPWSDKKIKNSEQFQKCA